MSIFLGESVVFPNGEFDGHVVRDILDSGFGGRCYLFIEKGSLLKYLDDAWALGNVVRVNGTLLDQLDHTRLFALGNKPYQHIATLDRQVNPGGLIDWALQYGAKAVLLGDRTTAATNGRITMIQRVQQLRHIFTPAQ